MATKGSFSVSGNIVDVINLRVFKGTVYVIDGKIASIEAGPVPEEQYILPGLIDAHVHIESSMLLPSEFARLAVVHGTVATVSDPHEIANVLGIEGVNFMIANGKKSPFKFFFGAPSCVPATPFETSGASLDVADTEALLAQPDIWYLSEMMNFPGVIAKDPEVMAKLAAAHKSGKPVDGHAPGVLGENARLYAQAGITTDHECFTLDEALDKIKWGMKVLIREGSAARNFDALLPLMTDHAAEIMFCSDDKHPDDLVRGHINLLVKRAIAKGYDPLQVIRACTLNPVMHYNIPCGLLRPGDDADFIITDNLSDFNIKVTYIRGIKVAENGRTLIDGVTETSPNKFLARQVTTTDLRVKASEGNIKVQKAFEGQLITEAIYLKPLIVDGCVESDTDRDNLKMMVMNRYAPSSPAVDFVLGFGLKHGAIASTVAHDSHNIIAVGTSDKDIVTAVNLLVVAKGGIALADGDKTSIMPLPVAGLMSDSDGYEVARRYEEINELAKALGSPLAAPYMTLSFMALLVIPALKLSDKGLFDGNTFQFTSLFDN
ncbi:MAG TPA: adenine deaminase [Bacteroidales bacterium]